MKNNQGTAIILSLLIVSVLFILTSFLVRKVVTNATMVEKTGEEQQSYALAKQGILYALDQLNTWDGTDPEYDPTDWTPNEVEQGNWSDYSNYSLMVYKNHIPTSGGYTEEEGYITIESRDLPKKLVTLQAIAKNDSPLLDYVRFINSEVRFSSNTTFGDVNSGALFHINGNLILDGDANEIYLEDNQRFEVASEIISYDSGSAQTDKVKIQPTIEASFSSKTLDDDGSGSDGYGFTGTIVNGDEYSQLDPEAFNTVQGRYFDSVHLPSSYDYSEDPDNPQYVSGESIISWPQINEERYGNLADLLISASNCGNQGLAWNDWYPSPFSSGTYWKQDGSTNSYNYTPPGVYIVLTDQDLDNSDGDDDPATGKDMMIITDSDANDDPAEYDSGNSFSWSTYSPSQTIYAPGDIRLEGIIPSGVKITVVSEGVIYIEGNLYQGDSSSSLALLAKKNVVFNTTHRWVVNSATTNSTIPYRDEWDGDAYLEGVTDTTKVSATIDTETGPSIQRQVLDFGGGTNNVWQVVSANHIVLHRCNWTVTKDTIQLQVEVSWDGNSWVEMVNESGSSPVLVASSDASGEIDIDAYIPSSSSYARVFRYLRISLKGDGDADDDQGGLSIDSIEITLEGVEGGVAVFSEEENWAIIPGNGLNSSNNQPAGLPLTFKGAFSEQKWEEKSKWDGTVSGDGQADWPNTIYRYDSNLSSNSPPALPPSVNLVSLKRK
ncbi:hypothetical protein CEE35_09340 [Candidatus Aerophobetes bacterium Ae_b3b]|nr:MAG: hypothetical protein CEE35_09340 [Candidatus Aerophobetes bacterium Ae_b3b]